MSQSTETDLQFLQNEDAARAYIHFVTPLIQQAVAAAIPPELATLAVELSQARQELADAKAELDEAKTKFITAEEAQRIGQGIGDNISGKLTTNIDQHLAELKEDDQRRSQAFDAQIGEVRSLALVQGNELATLKAVFEEKIEAHEKRLNKVETDIKTGVAAVARNTRTLSQAVGKWLEETGEKEQKLLKKLADEKTEVDKKLLANTEDIASIRGDVGELRGDIGATVRPMQDTVRELKPQVVALQVDMGSAKLTLDKVDKVAAAILWMFKDRRGNVLLASILMALCGFQLLFAFLAYQFIQRMPN